MCKPNDEFLLKMIDGGITDISYDQENWSGCPTCDYGSRYIDEFLIHLTQFSIKVKISAQYYHAFSEASLMKFFIQKSFHISTLTEMQFFAFIQGEALREAVDRTVKETWADLKEISVTKED